MIARAPFGRTGHESSRVIFGAAAFFEATEGEADSVLELLLERGINHIDTAASYGDSERLVGRWMDSHRSDFFLATKTGARDGVGARESLERSLERLRVDGVDLVQLHNLVEEDEWERAFGPGGAVEALVQARDEGLVRFIGVTGHGTRIASMHLRSLDRFAFDAVLFPYNAAMLSNPSYARDVELLIERAARDDVALQTIKSVARRRWTTEVAPDTRRFSWYEPLEDSPALSRAVRFVLGQPSLFLNSSSDFRLLPAILNAAAGALEMPSENEIEEDVQTFGIEPLFDGGALERA